MKKNVSRKYIFCALLLCTALFCPACGRNMDTAPDPNASAENFMENESQQIPDTPAEDADAGLSGENADRNTGNANGDPINDMSVSSTESGIKIEMRTEEEQKKTENGDVYLNRSYTYPVVTIDRNSAAADKINADIRSRIDAFTANTEVEEWAKQDFEFLTSEDSAYPFHQYEESLAFKTMRADSNVISFTTTYSSYTGGAHGNYNTRGVNYDARTGELIAFSDLSEDSAAFREDTLAYNQALAQTDAYRERMFSEEDITNGTLESVLYADDVWYLSTSGLVFMSGPYALGPFAAGTIEFIIPYGDLADMGFKDAYAYTDRLVLKLQENAVYHMDLNGDGQEDSILYHTEYAAGADDSYQTPVYLLINDVELSREGDAEVIKQLAEYSWAEAALYDLNPDDSYVELMFVSGESEGDDYVYYSHFYRYMEDGTLIYLGRVKGDANDPVVEVVIS